MFSISSFGGNVLLFLFNMTGPDLILTDCFMGQEFNCGRLALFCGHKRGAVGRHWCRHPCLVAIGINVNAGCSLTPARVVRVRGQRVFVYLKTCLGTTTRRFSGIYCGIIFGCFKMFNLGAIRCFPSCQRGYLGNAISHLLTNARDQITLRCRCFALQGIL